MPSKLYLLLAATIALSAQDQAQQSFYGRLPSVSTTLYAGVAITAAYCGYRVLRNEALRDNVQALYNLMYYGHVVSPGEKQAKSERRAQKMAAINTVQHVQSVHTAQLNKITDDIQSIRDLSSLLATKTDLEVINTRLGRIESQLHNLMQHAANIQEDTRWMNSARIILQGHRNPRIQLN